jgi:hypothetical protein
VTTVLGGLTEQLGAEVTFYAENVPGAIAAALRAHAPDHGDQLIAYLTALGGPYGRLARCPASAGWRGPAPS